MLYEAERVYNIEHPAPFFMKALGRPLYVSERNFHGVIGWCHNKKWGGAGSLLLRLCLFLRGNLFHGPKILDGYRAGFFKMVLQDIS